MLRLLLDEHLRGPLWQAIQRHNVRGGLPIDAVRVGDPPHLPLGSNDPAILSWADSEDRILVTEDVHTIPAQLTRHVQTGHHSPGVFVVRVGCSIGQVINHLELVAHAGMPEDFQDTVIFIP